MKEMPDKVKQAIKDAKSEDEALEGVSVEQMWGLANQQGQNFGPAGAGDVAKAQREMALLLWATQPVFGGAR
jgi:hypothetical protein